MLNAATKSNYGKPNGKASLQSVKIPLSTSVFMFMVLLGGMRTHYWSHYNDWSKKQKHMTGDIREQQTRLASNLNESKRN